MYFSSFSCSDEPCYHGSTCLGIPGIGFRCGACPNGMTGNAIVKGRSAEGCHEIKVKHCTPEMCFPGVTCHNTEQGPQCGSCPNGMIGNGTFYGCRSIRWIYLIFIFLSPLPIFKLQFMEVFNSSDVRINRAILLWHARIILENIDAVLVLLA